MRLLYVCSDFGIRPDGVKGASIHVRAILHALSALGHEVDWLSPYTMPAGSAPFRALLGAGPTEIVAMTDKVRGDLKRHGIETGAAPEVRSLLYNGWAVERAVQALESSPPDAILERLSLFSHVGVDLAAHFGCPLVIEANALLSKEAREHRNLQMGPLAEEIELVSLQRADAVLAVSRVLQDMLVGQGVDPAKITVVPNGVDLPAFDAPDDGADVRRRFGFADGFVIGFVGSLKPWHGVDVLLDAFTRMPDSGKPSFLMIVGAGPAERELRRQASEAGVAHRVVFTGAVPHAEIAAFLAACDVAVAPYPRIDGFYFSPIKLFEYMAAGRCIIASRIGQIEDVISDGENGFLCSPGDPAELAWTLNVTRADPELRRRLGTNARAVVARHYTWERTAHSVCEVIAPLVDAARTTPQAPPPVNAGVLAT